MKQIIFTLVLFMTTIGGIYAQNTTATANLNLKINSFQSINVVGDINLEYRSIEDFSRGVEMTMQDHLSVFSTGGFTVYVKTASDLVNGNETIEAEKIKVTASKGSVSTLPNVVFTPVNLKTTPQTLIRSNDGAPTDKFNVTYKALGNNENVNKHKGASSAVFTTTVIYSIEAS
jgi:hypothetical protein